MSRKLVSTSKSEIIADFTCANTGSSVTVHFDIPQNPQDIMIIMRMDYTNNNDGTTNVKAINWMGNKATQIKIDGNKLPSDTNYSSINSITHVNYFNATGLKTLNSTFRGCKQLTDMSTTYWRFLNNVDMSYAFADSGIRRIDATNWDLSKITNVTNMFANCKDLSFIRLVSSDASKITSIVNQLPTHTSSEGTFTVDISGNTSSVLSSLSNLARTGWTIKR